MKFSKALSNGSHNLSLMHLLAFVIGFPLRKLKRVRNVLRIKSYMTLEERFTNIYKGNLWGSKESVSGSGSTAAMTIPIRTMLPVLFEEFQISSIFDAPCGDFNWMRMVDLEHISYVGGDIVEPMIRKITSKYASSNISFIKIDITKEQFPPSDLVINRDCLFHLSYEDILLTLENFLDSDSKYFLSTSHDNNQEFVNTDILSGNFRLIDLFIYPFNFPADYLFRIAEKGEGMLPPRKLYLWNKNQVVEAHANLEHSLRSLVVTLP